MTDFPHIAGRRTEPGRVAKAIGRLWAKPVLVLARLALRLNPTVSVAANLYGQTGVSVWVPDKHAVIMINCHARNDLHPALEELSEHVDNLSEKLFQEAARRRVAERELAEVLGVRQ